MTNQKIYYRKARDFGEIFGGTISYLKRNFKSLFGAILALAGPFFLLNSIASSFLLKFSFLRSAYSTNPMQMLNDMIGPLALVIFFSIIGSSVYNTVVNDHILLNDELPPDEKPSLSLIAKRFFSSYWRNLGVMFLMLFFGIIAYVVFALIIVGLVFLLKGIGFIGIFLMILMFMLLFFILFPIMLYIIVAIIFTSQRHKLSFFSATSRVFHYLKGNFWMTWLISFVGGMCTYILVIIAYLPVYILMMISFFSRANLNNLNSINNIQTEIPLYVTILTSIVSLLIICISSIYLVMMNFQCASNEEKKDGTSILEKIESI